MFKRQGYRKGFTLIELLIVIAIIAILALIAIPNFLDAQVRAKVSRVHSDMRSLAVAIEAYFVDNNAYPRVSALRTYDNEQNGYMNILWWSGDQKTYRQCKFLTTPVAYITQFPLDPFPTRHDEEARNWGTAGSFLDFSYIYVNFHGAAMNKHLSTGARHELALNLVQPMPARFNGPNGKVFNSMFALISCGPDRTSEEKMLHDPTIEVRLSELIKSETNVEYLQAGYFPTYDPTNGTISNGNIWRCSGQGVE